MGELAFNALLFLACVILTIYGTQIPISGSDVLARYWPIGILVVLMILFAFRLVKIWQGIPAEKRSFKTDFKWLKSPALIRLLLSCVWLILYAWALPYAGYVLATYVFCMGLMVLLGARSVPKILCMSLVLTVALFAVFSWGLRVSLPRGIGPLEGFGKWLEYLI